MNKILFLFDENYVLDFFNKKVLPLYPNFQKIVGLKIYPYKKLIWTTTYHVVISYRVTFLNKAGKEKEMEIVCSAHSSEQRESVFHVLRFLWKSKFFKGDLVIPRPLFYDDEFNGTFYRAVSGRNLLYFIKATDKTKTARMVERAARLFAGLHQVKLPNDTSIFNDSNRLIRNVVPGREMIISELKDRFQDLYFQKINDLYELFIKQEEEFLNKESRRWLIHGDAHPENIIAVGRKKIGLIDFTDFCPGDFARDLGTFLQQLEYKIKRYFADPEFALEMKELFLKIYFEASGMTLDSNLQQRIDLYYNWTAVRTVVFWLLKHDAEPLKAAQALVELEANLKSHRHAQN